MDRISVGCLRKIAVGLLLFGIASCAAIPRLNISYRLPPKTAMQETPIYLTIQDERQSPETMGTGARKDFGGPQEAISFVAKSNGEESGVGVYELPALLREGFKKRLERAGYEVVSERRDAKAEISILLKDFFLDLVDRKWRFIMRYEARLIKDDKVLATQMTNGNAERLKVIGRNQADEVVSEVFTDTLNQFDPNRLFRQAGLR